MKDVTIELVPVQSSGTQPPPSAPRRGRWLLRLVGLAAAALAVFLVSVSFRIVRTASLHQVHAVDAIVVFGAAEYSGHPSPVFRARLDHGLDLFRLGIAPVLITT